MRAKEPRLDLIAEEDWHEDLARNLAAMKEQNFVYNIFRVLANHPKAMKSWSVFGNHVLAHNSLNPREREIVILRIGWLCQAEYEWAQHVIIGRGAGLSDEEIERIKAGPSAPGWSETDLLLLKASDELKHQSCISDSTWEGLAAHYSKKQLIDIIFTAGNYVVVSMMQNSLGVPFDDFLGRFDRPPKSGQ